MADQTIPQRYVVTCTYCASQIDSRAPTTYHRGTAWFKNQKAGKAGGANAAALIKRSNEFACTFCIHKIMDGIPLGQMGLWDDQ